MVISLLIPGAFFSLSGQTGMATIDRKPEKIITADAVFNSLDIDTEGNIILLDREQGQIYKYLYISDFDSSITIGGKSHRNEGFLNPVKLSVKNRQNLYVLDDVARRVILLNTNFKVSGEINFLTLNTQGTNAFGEDEIYPVNFDTSVDGTLFILNQLDNKIYVINPFGELVNTFGGLDYGAGALSQPVDIQVNDKNFVFVSDTVEQEIKVFDNFGIFRTTMIPGAGFRWDGFSISKNYLICFDKTQIFLKNLVSGKGIRFQTGKQVNLNDIKLKGDYLYLLLENEVHLYPLTSMEFLQPVSGDH